MRNRPSYQSERQVRAQKIRLVVIIKRVAGKRRVAFERLIVAQLNQVAAVGIDLGRGNKRDEQRQPQNQLAHLRHAAEA